MWNVGGLRPSLGKDTPSAAINCWPPSDSSLNYTNNDSYSFSVADNSSMTDCSTCSNVPCQCYFSCHTTVINDIHVGNHDVVYQHEAKSISKLSGFRIVHLNCP